MQHVKDMVVPATYMGELPSTLDKLDKECIYCKPADANWSQGLCKNLLEDDEDEVAVLISDGKLIIDIDIETEWDYRSDGYMHAYRHGSVKVNYCPMCGRKL